VGSDVRSRISDRVRQKTGRGQFDGSHHQQVRASAPPAGARPVGAVPGNQDTRGGMAIGSLKTVDSVSSRGEVNG
jgi:hypothetical protein